MSAHPAEWKPPGRVATKYSSVLSAHTSRTSELWEAASELLSTRVHGNQPVRLLGMGVGTSDRSRLTQARSSTKVIEVDETGSTMLAIISASVLAPKLCYAAVRWSTKRGIG